MITEIRSFHGLCGVPRTFVPNFVKNYAPLEKLLKQGTTTRLDLVETELVVEDELRNYLTYIPILVLPWENKPFPITADTSDKQVGCVLLLEKDANTLRQFGYFARALNVGVCRYETTRKYGLSVVLTSLLLGLYVRESRFISRTDHQAFPWIMDFKDSTGQSRS